MGGKLGSGWGCGVGGRELHLCIEFHCARELCCVVLRVHQWHRARARGGVATRVFICARESRELVKKGWRRMCERAARLHVGCVACEQW